MENPEFVDKKHMIFKCGLLHVACRHNLPFLFYHLLLMDCDCSMKNGDNVTPLHLASAHAQADFVDKLTLKAPETINALDNQGKSALFWAVKACNLEIVQILVEREAAVNQKSKTGLTPLL